MPSNLFPAAVLMTLLCPAAAFFVPDNQGILPHRVTISDFLNTPLKFIGGAQPIAPLYITVGPPTSGKTTWLRKLKEQAPHGTEALLDISLDDCPNVYVPVPYPLLCLTPAEMEGPELPYEYQQWLSQSYYQRTVAERILSEEHQELRLVLLRLSGKISSEEFQRSLWSFHSSTFNHQEDSRDRIEFVLKTVVESVENLMGNQAVFQAIPKTVNLFVEEALFHKDPLVPHGEWSGVERALSLLQDTPTNVPLSWGNTNTQPSDYIVPLSIAAEQGRPVHFCVYGDENTVASDEKHFYLPKLEFRELIDRNLHRLIQTGQYIPCKVIDGLAVRAENLVTAAMQDIESRNGSTKLDFDRQLALMAGFDLLDDRTVKKRQDHKDHGHSQVRYDDPLYWPGRIQPRPRNFPQHLHSEAVAGPHLQPPHVVEHGVNNQIQTQHNGNFHSNERHGNHHHHNGFPSDHAATNPNFKDPGIQSTGGLSRFQRHSADNSDNPLDYQGRASKKQTGGPAEDWGTSRNRQSYKLQRGNDNGGANGHFPKQYNDHLTGENYKQTGWSRHG